MKEQTGHESGGRRSADALIDERAEVPPSNRVIDTLGRVLPDLSMLGLFVLLTAVYLAATGSNFGASDDVLSAVRDGAQPATESAGYVPF